MTDALQQREDLPNNEPKDTDPLLGNHEDAMSPEEQDAEDRLGFIRKVFYILSAQLVFTAFCVFVVKKYDALNAWFMQQWFLGITLAIVSLIIQCVLLCCVNVARKVPINFILLSVFTACFTFVVCFVTSYYTAVSVTMAAAMTAGMTLTITLYAVTTKTDFTICGGLFYIFFAGLFMLMIFSLFVKFPAWWEPVLSSILVMLYGLYLIYDV